MMQYNVRTHVQYVATPEGIAVRSRHHTALDDALEWIHIDDDGDDGDTSPVAATKRCACRSARAEIGWWLACSID